MNFKKFFVALFFILFSNNLFAKPMCKIFYDRIYNEANYKDAVINTFENQKTIGIRLLQKWDKENSKWILDKNKDGYFKVGKITTEQFYSDLPVKIEIGDVLLSINDRDLREINDSEKIKLLRRDVSEIFEENELIKFEFLKNGKKIIIDRTKNSKEPNLRNELKSFRAPFLDLYVKSIKIEEKKSSFTASLETVFYEEIDERYSISKIIFDELIKDKEYENGKLTNFYWYQCPFDDEEWADLDTVDIKYGMKFDSLVEQDKDLYSSYYNIKPRWDFKIIDNSKGYFIEAENKGQLEYFSSGVYTFSNKFNLKTFPFDKQVLRIFLYNDKYPLDDRRASVSNYSALDANKFSENNTIPGWDINNVTLNYDIHTDYEDKIYDGVAFEIDISRKSGYYIFKIIIPIILILMVCWSAVWINPREIESRLTVTIVCLLSLIAYNFVIDSDMPKLEYLTIMDYLILVSYVYATIPNFLSIYSFYLIKKDKARAAKYESFEKKYGLPSYILIILLIIIFSVNTAPENTKALFSWMSLK